MLNIYTREKEYQMLYEDTNTSPLECHTSHKFILLNLVNFKELIAPYFSHEVDVIAGKMNGKDSVVVLPSGTIILMNIIRLFLYASFTVLIFKREMKHVSSLKCTQ